MKVPFRPTRDDREDLGETLRHFFKLHDLDQDEALARIRRQLEDSRYPSTESLAEQLQQLAMGDHGCDPQWRRGVVNFVQGLASSRMVILWLEDIHHSREALPLCQDLLASRQAPIFVLMTLRNDALTDPPEPQAVLDEIRSLPEVQTLSLELLSQSEQRQMIRNLLPLEDDLVVQIARRTAGNPRFAAELLREWIEQGLLTVEDGLFRPATKERPDLPDLLHHAWSQRIHDLLNRFDGEYEVVKRGLELAACYGEFQVERKEWEVLFECAGLDIDSGLISAAVDEQLVIIDGAQAIFTDEMLRESLLREAANAGRLQQHHQICAQTLRGLYSEDRSGGVEGNVLERLSHHLIVAGRGTEVVEPLLELAWEQTQHQNYHRGLENAQRVESALDSLDVADGHRHRLRSWLIQAWCKQHLNPELAKDDIQRLRQHLQLPRDRDLVGEVERLCGVIASSDSRFDEAQRHYRRAEEHFQSIGARERLGRVYYGLAYLWQYTGEYEASVDYFERALQRFVATSSWVRVAETYRGLANAAMGLGQYEEARQYFHQALKTLHEYCRDDAEHIEVAIQSDLGDALRYLGDLEAAEEAYQKAFDVFSDKGSNMASTQAMNLALVAVMKGDYEAVFSHCRFAIHEINRTNFTLFLGAAYLLICCGAAGMNNRALWDQYLPEAIEILKDAPVIERDIGWAAEEAARLAHDNGWHVDSHRVLRLSLPIWDALHDDDALERVRSQLDMESTPID